MVFSLLIDKLNDIFYLVNFTKGVYFQWENEKRKATRSMPFGNKINESIIMTIKIFARILHNFELTTTSDFLQITLDFLFLAG